MTPQWNEKILIDLNPGTSPVFWVNSIFTNADDKSTGLVAGHLVATVLQKRYPALDVRVLSARKGNLNSKRSSIIAIGSLTYHVTIDPTAAVIRRCKQNLSTGLKVILLVPNAEINKAVALAQESRIVNFISIFGIENYVSLSTIMMSCDRQAEPIEAFKDILRLYNQRIRTTEPNLSIEIELL